MRVINAIRSLRDKAIIFLLFATGCRLTELLMLRVNDINFEEKTLYMWTLKRKKARRYQRLVYVNEATLELIREYMGV